MASAWLVFVFLLNQTSCAVRSYNPNLQPSPELGNWSNLLELKSGDQIIVKLRDGSEMKCRLKNATPDFISVALAEEGRQIEKGQVVRVDKLVDDRLLDGALIGTALGFLAGFLAEGLIYHVAGDEEGFPDLISLAFGGAGLAIGALSGALGDRALRKRVTVYQNK